jgi:hypothetical protein
MITLNYLALSPWVPNMSIDVKIRIGLLLVTLAISAFAAKR